MLINPYRFAAATDYVAEYLFNTDADASDTSGNNHDGTLQPDASVSAGILSLDGTGDYVEVADSDKLSFASGGSDLPFSISVWLRSTEAIGSNQSIVEKGDRGDDTREWLLNFDINGRLSLFCINPTGSAYITTATNEIGFYVQNSWQHWVATYDGSGSETGITLYKDKVDVTGTQSEVGTYTSMTAGAGVMNIGARTNSGTADNFFQGDMDNLRIYDYVIDSTEIEARFDEGHD